MQQSVWDVKVTYTDGSMEEEMGKERSAKCVINQFLPSR